MNAQVFTTRTSASSADDVISMPRARTLPSMISASTRFFAQPRLIMPTFVLIAWNETEPPMLLDRDVVVAAGNRLAVFLNLNCFAIQNADRDFLAAEFHRPVRR